MDVDGKVLKYENFLNERLRSDLKKVFLANQSTRNVRNDYMIDVPPESSFFFPYADMAMHVAIDITMYCDSEFPNRCWTGEMLFTLTWQSTCS